MDYEQTTNSVVAIFSDRQSAENARQELIRNGFNSGEVEVTTTDEFRRDAASGNTGLSGTHHDASGGGIGGFFRRLLGEDSTDDDRDYYSRAATRGGAAVIVHADADNADRAAEILNTAGAVDIDEHAGIERTESSFTGDVGRRGAVDERGESGTIPVIREELEVGKRAVQRGAVRVHSNVTNKPVQEDVRLREERVRVDRHPVDRPASEADIAAADRDVIEVTETVEEPVINKKARVVEEVRLSKEVNERTETVRDNVRNSDVQVEDSRRSSGGSSLSDDFRKDFTTRYGSEGNARYEEYEPAYKYGYQMASDPRYKGRRFDEVENDLRADYGRSYPNSTWERIKDSVRYGWDRVTGNR